MKNELGLKSGDSTLHLSLFHIVWLRKLSALYFCNKTIDSLFYKGNYFVKTITFFVSQINRPYIPMKTSTTNWRWVCFVCFLLYLSTCQSNGWVDNTREILLNSKDKHQTKVVCKTDNSSFLTLIYETDGKTRQFPYFHFSNSLPLSSLNFSKRRTNRDFRSN